MNMTGNGSLDLPNPDWSDSKSTVRSLITSRAMLPGVAYSYVREPVSSGDPIQRLSFVCSNIDRSRLKEIVTWIENNIDAELVLTDADGVTWSGYLVNTEHSIDVIRQGHYYGSDEEILNTQYEGISIPFEFEGYSYV